MDNYELAKKFNDERHNMSPAAYQEMRNRELIAEADAWYELSGQFLDGNFAAMKCPHCGKQVFSVVLFPHHLFISCRICTRFTRPRVEEYDPINLKKLADLYTRTHPNALEVTVKLAAPEETANGLGSTEKRIKRIIYD
jgi:hypothetical protein